MSAKKKVPSEAETLDKIRDILHGQQIAEMSERIDEMEKSIKKDFKQVNEDIREKYEQLFSEIKAFHELLNEQSKSLNELLSEKTAHLEKQLTDATNELKSSKVDRKELAALLNDMATFLSASKD